MNKTKGMLPLLLAMVVITMVGCGTQVPSGHRGVFFNTFSGGTEFGQVYNEGFNWHFPWNKMIVYRTQIQERKEDLTVLSSDGATIRIQVSILYHPLAARLDSLKMIGIELDELPTTIIFELGDEASLSVASIPFHFK